MPKKISGRTLLLFFGILLGILVLNFIHDIFGLSYLNLRLFFHAGIIIFSFFALIFSLRLNKKSLNFIFVGLFLWILLNSFLFLSYLFPEYSFLQTNLLVFLGIVAGVLMIIKGFKEAVND